MIYIRSIYPDNTESFTEARHIDVFKATKNDDGFLEAYNTVYGTTKKLTQSTNTSLATIQLYNSKGHCIRGYKSGVVIDIYGQENGLYVLIDEE